MLVKGDEEEEEKRPPEEASAAWDDDDDDDDNEHCEIGESVLWEWKEQPLQRYPLVREVWDFDALASPLTFELLPERTACER